jgi:phosphotransferase system  glucose/maltose/N-acetylglucosamine-specific IIC component
MKLCFLAKVVFLLSIIGISLDIYLAGLTLMSFLQNVILIFLFVWITNWSCYKESYNWVAWVIVILTLIMLMTTIFVVKNKNKEEVKKAIEEEKKNRQK